MNLDDVRKSLMVESLIQNKNGIMTRVNVSVKKQWNIAYMKKIMLGILVYLLVSDKGCEIDECLKECTCTKRLADDLFTCHQIVYIPETAIVNPNSKTNYWVNCYCFISSHVFAVVSSHRWEVLYKTRINNSMFMVILVYNVRVWQNWYLWVHKNQ